VEKNKEEKAVAREGDVAVRLIKLLHQRNGVSKEEIAKELGVSTRMVQKYLRKIDPDMCVDKKYAISEEKIEPFFIGGQPLRAKISIKREGRKEYYFTENSIHPIVLQENLTQIIVLIKIFADKYYGSDSNIIYKIACDIWSQLSEYGKTVVKLFFTERHRFIEQIEEDVNSDYAACYERHNNALRFIEQIEEEVNSDYVACYESRTTSDYTLDDEILWISKLGKECNVQVRISNNQIKEYKQVKITQCFQDKIILKLKRGIITHEIEVGKVDIVNIKV
jgi:transcriptional antiterminator